MEKIRKKDMLEKKFCSNIVPSARTGLGLGHQLEGATKQLVRYKADFLSESQFGGLKKSSVFSHGGGPALWAGWFIV